MTIATHRRLIRLRNHAGLLLVAAGAAALVIATICVARAVL